MEIALKVEELGKLFDKLKILKEVQSGDIVKHRESSKTD